MSPFHLGALGFSKLGACPAFPPMPSTPMFNPAPLQQGFEPGVPRRKGNILPTKVWSWCHPRSIISLLIQR